MRGVRMNVIVAWVLTWHGCGPAQTPALERFTIEMSGTSDALSRKLVADVEAGVAHVEAYFGAPFPRPFVFHVFSDRQVLDAHWAALWGEPELHTECWMVGMGSSGELSILSPTRWRDQACEHDPSDAAAVRMLIAHELVHTYHSQLNRRIDRDNEAAAGLAWFVEGLAVVVSGQLASGRHAPAAEAIASHRAPNVLAEAWSGKFRYGVSGSLVAYIESRWGRRMVRRLIHATTPGQVLDLLGQSEGELLAGWLRWVERGGGHD